MSEPASCVPVVELVKLRDGVVEEAERQQRDPSAIAIALDFLIEKAHPCGDERWGETLQHILTVNTDEPPGPDVHYPVALTADEALGIIHILARAALSHARGDSTTHREVPEPGLMVPAELLLAEHEAGRPALDDAEIDYWRWRHAWNAVEQALSQQHTEE